MKMKFSLNRGLILVAFACLIFALTGRWHAAAVAQRRSVDEFRKRGNSVYYAHELWWEGDSVSFPDPATTSIYGTNLGGFRGLILRFLGPDYVSDVSVLLFFEETPDNALDLASGMKDLRHVWKLGERADERDWKQRFPKLVFHY